jgi:acetoin utilization deacetylase AcuC-like enzyme
VILYDPTQPHSLTDFGIEIPVMDSRASQTFARLCAHPLLGARVASWHVDRIRDSVSRPDLLRVHSGAYVERLFSEQLESEIVRTYELVDESGGYHRFDPRNARLPLTALFERILTRAAGTLQGCRLALAEGFSFYFGGGMHHAQRDHGAGFCLVNDLVIALRRLQAENRIRRAWIIDVDAHKGDGTAAITAADESIATLSIHMANGWPLDRPERDEAGRLNPSFIPSTIDIPIGSGEEPFYNHRLREGLERLSERSPPPDLALVVDGADPYELDELPSTGGLRLPLDRLLERDQLLYTFLRERSVPGAFVMAGGYGKSSWRVYTQFLEWALSDRLASHPSGS